MTRVDRFIPYQFWFEYGIGKLGIYIGMVNLGLLIVTMLTVKGIYFPVWSIIPIAIAIVLFCTFFGWFLDTYNIMGRLGSHMNQRGNPELLILLESMARLERKIDELEIKITTLEKKL